MPLDIKVTQFPDGIGTVKDNDILNALPLPSPGSAMLSIEDFDAANVFADTYSQLALGGGATQAQVLAANGVVTFTSGGADNDGVKAHADVNATAVDSFQIIAGVPAWFAARFQLDDVVQSDLLLGFVPGAATIDPVPADGVFLAKDDGSADLFVRSVNSAAATSQANIGAIAANTWYVAALYWDGIDKVSAQFTGPDGVIGGGGTILPGANLPASTTGLEPSFGFQAGEAAAKVLTVDWVLFASGR